MGCRPSKADFLSAKLNEDSVYVDHSSVEKAEEAGFSGAKMPCGCGCQCQGSHAHRDSGIVLSSNSSKRTLSHSSSEFSTVTTISGRSKIRVTLSSDGSMIEVEKYEPYDAFESPVLERAHRGCTCTCQGHDNKGYRSDRSVSPAESRSSSGARKPPPKMRSMPNLRMALLGSDAHSGPEGSQKKHAQIFKKKRDKNFKFPTLRHSKTENFVPGISGEKIKHDPGLSGKKGPHARSVDLLCEGESVKNHVHCRRDLSDHHLDIKSPRARFECDIVPAKLSFERHRNISQTTVVDLHNYQESSDGNSNSIKGGSSCDLLTSPGQNPVVISNGNDLSVIDSKSPGLPKSGRAKSSTSHKKSGGRLFRKSKSDLSDKSALDFAKKSDCDIIKKNVTHSENSSIDINSDFEDDLVALTAKKTESSLEYELSKLQVHQDFFNDFGDDFNDDDFTNS